MQDAGQITITLSNVYPNRSVKLDVVLHGKSVSKIVDAFVLTAPQVNSVNTFEKSDTVQPVPFEDFSKKSDQFIQVELPVKSLVLLNCR